MPGAGAGSLPVSLQGFQSSSRRRPRSLMRVSRLQFCSRQGGCLAVGGSGGGSAAFAGLGWVMVTIVLGALGELSVCLTLREVCAVGKWSLSVARNLLL